MLALPLEVVKTRLLREAVAKGDIYIDAIAADFEECVIAGGLPAAEYAESLQGWDGLDEYLCQAGHAVADEPLSHRRSRVRMGRRGVLLAN